MTDDFQKRAGEALTALPDVVRNAILSGNIQEKFRALAPKYKLHVDQWQEIENTIMLTVLGLSPVEELEEQIIQKVNLPRQTADDIVNDVALTIFKPIREELERELGHPQAKEEQLSDIEKVREQMLSQTPSETPAMSAPVAPEATVSVPPLPTPATPPPPPPTEKVIRMPASGAYKPGEPSTVRADVHDDPYREPPA